MSCRQPSEGVSSRNTKLMFALFATASTEMILIIGTRAMSWRSVSTTCLASSGRNFYIIFSSFHLQHKMDAVDLLHISAAIHAIWRCRNTIVHGTHFSSSEVHFGKIRTVVICMFVGPGGRDHDSQQRLFGSLDPPNYVNQQRKIPKQFQKIRSGKVKLLEI